MRKVRRQLQPTGDGWYTATLGPLPEGLYRVSSLAGMEPVTDLVTVVGE